jgi:hypothetical protein
MKKKAFMGIMLLVAAMIFSAGGTCLAQDTVIVDTNLSGTTRLSYGPVFSWAEQDNQRGTGSGASCYGIIGDPFSDCGIVNYSSATPFAVARDILDAGLNMNLVWADDALSANFTGTTPVGCPVVISGETNAFVVAVQAGLANPAAVGLPSQVADFTLANNGNTGVTIMLIDGQTMTANWVRGLPERLAAAGNPGAQVWQPINGLGGAYYPTELTVWTPNQTLDATGATIYGTSGADVRTWNSGSSIWALTNWGAYAANGTATTAWPNAPFSYNFTGSNQVIAVNGGGIASVSAINGFVASPVISGESIFYIGYACNPAVTAGGGREPLLNGSGITIYQMDKDELGGGVLNMAPFKEDNVAQAWSDRYMPTPVVSGGSLFVVCNQGGVTVYDTQDLVWGGNRTAGYIGNILLPQGVFTGVTASPVVLQTGQNDPYIIMCGTSAVTCWNISDGLASVPTQRRWWYDFAAHIGVNSQIWGTPAVADGYVFVPVADFVGSDGAIYAFDIDATPDLANGELQWAEQYNLNSEAVASPILIDRQLWAFSFGTAAANNARVTQWDVSNLISDDYSAQNYWTQFKFDAAKTGDGTKIDDDDDYVEGSSGCFLSIVR